jgi:gluconokinase/6-phosphogluconolactonase
MAATDQRTIIRLADPAALAEAAAARLLARISANKEQIAICLTGGSGPMRLYELLATEAYRNRIPWDRVHWFIGDERFVPSGDPLHNMTVARQIFLDRCAPGANIHPIPTDGASPDECAARYERTLKSFYGAGYLDATHPLFDLVLMGLGPDGHTASLFPGYPALKERRHWALGVATAPVEPRVPRVTLTLHVLGSCREMLFEVAGPEKRAILTRVLAGENLPANRAHATGETVWLVDEAALPEKFGGE